MRQRRRQRNGAIDLLALWCGVNHDSPIRQARQARLGPGMILAVRIALAECTTSAARRRFKAMLRSDLAALRRRDAPEQAQIAMLDGRARAYVRGVLWHQREAP